MSDPRPLRRGDARAGALLERAAEVEPWADTDRQEVWRRLATRPGPRGLAYWWPVPASALAAALVMVAIRLHGDPSPLAGEREQTAQRSGQGDNQDPLPQRGRGQGEGTVIAEEAVKGAVNAEGSVTLDLGPAGTLQADAASVYELAPDHASLRLTAGRVCAAIHHRDAITQGPFVVLAPSLRVVDLGTRFCVDARAGRTEVEVTDGQVRVEAEGGRAVTVAAGQRIDSRDARLAPPVPGVAPQVPSSCDQLASLEARERCFAAVSTGDDLAAQNALYSLALIARDQRHEGPTARALFETYLRRFPGGPLAPEASLGVLTELAAEARWADAAAEARAYLAAHPVESKAPEVRLMLANLERERLGSPAAARDAYAEVLRAPADTDVQAEALFGLALADLQLGDRGAAETAFRRYLAEHPQGPRAGDAGRLLRR